MIVAALLGAGTGLGLLLIWHGLAPARLDLSAAITALHPRPTPPPPQGGGWAARLGAPATVWLHRAGLPRPATRADLQACQRHPDHHLAEQAAAATAGLLLAPTLAAALALGGIRVGWTLPLWAGLALAALGALTPDLVVRAQARRRRAQLRTALSGLLDITVISLAGGAGVEQALHDAADNPRTWAQRQLHLAIHAATAARLPPWTTLGQLGAHVGVPALVELAAALSLAGHEGARVRATLTARAAAMREHELADAEAEAASATEKMSLPLVALFAGFLCFLGYPALAAVLTAL